MGSVCGEERGRGEGGAHCKFGQEGEEEEGQEQGVGGVVGDSGEVGRAAKLGKEVRVVRGGVVFLGNCKVGRKRLKGGRAGQCWQEGQGQ